MIFTFLIISLQSIHAIDFKETYKTTTISISPDSFSYKLPDTNILKNSEIVYSDKAKLSREFDYNIDFDNGIIFLLNSDVRIKHISVSYYVLPEFLSKKYMRYEQTIQDSLGIVTKEFKPRTLFQEDGKLLISGSKTFSLTFSNQQSYDLKQSLFISLEGELGNNMNIEGRLSDSQSPLTPEGDSKELSTLDQVFLKLYGKEYFILLGDHDLDFNKTDLMKYRTKIEGITLNYDDRFAIQGTYAANGGIRMTNIIQGIDGKQGPYYLYADVNNQNVQIVPGSESVSVNGESLQRGADYTIDYSEGTIVFKKLITSNSRIIVDFQYTSDYYRQNMFFNSSRINLSPSLVARHHLIHQSDEKNNPLLWTLSQSDIDSLRLAGDNITWGQGILEAEPGNGSYILLTDESGNDYFEYAPNDSTAIYQIYFTFVGFGNGDYEPFGSNRYKFIGKNQGSWLPIKKLIAPQTKTNMGLSFEFIDNSFNIKSEGLISNYDKNTFSNKDDNDNIGFIGNSELRFSPEKIILNPNIRFRHQIRTDNIYLFSNITTAQEQYETDTLPDAENQAQTKYGIDLETSLDKVYNQTFSYQFKNVFSSFKQQSIRFTGLIFQYAFIPTFKMYSFLSRQTFSDSLLQSSEIGKHFLENKWKYRFISLENRMIYHNDIYNYSSADTSSRFTGTRFTSEKPSLTLSDDKSYNTSLSWSEETNRKKIGSLWSLIQKSNTTQFDQFINSKTNMLNLKYIYRDVQNYKDNSENGKRIYYNLFDLKSSHQFFDNSVSLLTYYQLNQLEFFPKIRELYFVGNGLGMYDSTGVQINGGDYDYYYINSGSSKLSSDINTNMSVNFHLSKKYAPQSFWQRVQIESSFQINENTDRKNTINLFLLLPDETFQESSTIYGRRMFQNRLWVNLWRNEVITSFRHEISDIMDNRYQVLSLQKDRDFQLELDVRNIYENRILTTFQNRNSRDSKYNSEISTNSLSTTVYRNFSPSLNTNIVISYAHEQGKTQDQTNSYDLDIYKFNPSASYFFLNKYRFSSNALLQYNNRYGSNLLTFFPEKRNGVIFNWTIQTRYRLNNFTSGSVEYTIKSYPSDSAVHEFKMEFRAEL